MKKKILMLLLACVLLIVGSISVYAVVDACSHNNGVAMQLTGHDRYGYDGCIADERYYCDVCNETLYTVTDAIYTVCPKWHRY